jgi:glycosyltransferase involved in cell wall biosynthesis
MGKIYYIIPDLHNRQLNFIEFMRSIRHFTLKKYFKNRIFPKHKPVGGVKVIYQHCLMLKDLGYNVYPLLMGKYVGNFFGYDLEFKHINDIGYDLRDEDVVIATEFRPYQGIMFKNATKILFSQSSGDIYIRIKPEDKDKNYIDLGYDYVITCGKFCTDSIRNKMGIESTTITNGIDQEKFCYKPEVRVPGRVLAMSRKKPDDLKLIIKLVEDRGAKVDLHVVDGLTQAELIKEYQQADIFLATGYPEGLPLPPLEAMNCGCTVVGFTGGGADEYMIDNVTALVSEDGDCADAAKKLIAVLNDTSLKERIRKSGLDKARQYTLDNTKKLLHDFVKSVVTQTTSVTQNKLN